MAGEPEPSPVERPWLQAPLAPLYLAILLVLLQSFWQGLAFQVLLSTGFYGHRYGDEALGAAQAKEDSPERQRARSQLNLWASALGFPFWLASLPAIVRLLPGLSLRDLGLSRERIGRNVMAGFLAGLLLTPVVAGVNLAVIWWYTRVAGPGAEEHPFTRLARGGLGPDEWTVLLFSAVIAAPVFEEIVFRGVLQPWFIRTWWGGWVAMAGAAGFALLARQDRLRPALAEGLGNLAWELAPVLFVLGLLVYFVILWTRSPTSVDPGIFGGAVLFAAVHSFAWPSPVALTVLALGLGNLAYTTHGVIAPMIMHATFNAINCLLLFVGLGGGG
jgi:membrane protease YdiL (CAAX protease family)